MSVAVDGFHSNYDLVDWRILQRKLAHISHPDFTFPIRSRGRSGHNGEAGKVWLRRRLIPFQNRIVPGASRQTGPLPPGGPRVTGGFGASASAAADAALI